MTDASPRTLIVGAGPAGLATAACLGRRDQPYEIIEREDAVGARWRGHYERLHLHTVSWLSHLPYRKFPPTCGTYPSRRQVVAYLDDYAESFGINPRFNTEVLAAHKSGQHWAVQTNGGQQTVTNLIVASGYNAIPHVPSFPAQEQFGGVIVHSRDYVSGRPFRGQRVLVVGSGNSGAEIVLDLFECGASPSICIRGPIHVAPRDVLGVPAQTLAMNAAKLPRRLVDLTGLALSRAAYPDLEELGIRRPTKGPVSMLVEDGRVPLVDIGTIELIRQGVVSVLPAIREFDDTGITFVNGHRHEFDAVVLATGYTSGLRKWLRFDGLDDRGLPKVFGAPAAPGLYFVGFRNPPTGALHDIAREAQRVAEHIGARSVG